MDKIERMIEKEMNESSSDLSVSNTSLADPSKSYPMRSTSVGGFLRELENTIQRSILYLVQNQYYRQVLQDDALSAQVDEKIESFLDKLPKDIPYMIQLAEDKVLGNPMNLQRYWGDLGTDTGGV